MKSILTAFVLSFFSLLSHANTSDPYRATCRVVSQPKFGEETFSCRMIKVESKELVWKADHIQKYSLGMGGEGFRDQQAQVTPDPTGRAAAGLVFTNLNWTPHFFKLLSLRNLSNKDCMLTITVDPVKAHRGILSESLGTSFEGVTCGN